MCVCVSVFYHTFYILLHCLRAHSAIYFLWPDVIFVVIGVVYLPIPGFEIESFADEADHVVDTNVEAKKCTLALSRSLLSVRCM